MERKKRVVPREVCACLLYTSILGIEYTDKAVIRMYALWEHEPTIEADDMFFSIKQARNGGITAVSYTHLDVYKRQSLWHTLSTMAVILKNQPGYCLRIRVHGSAGYCAI